MRGVFKNPPPPTPRDELIRELYGRFVKDRKLQEIPRDSLERGPFGRITADDARYREYRGAILEATYTPVSHYYRDGDRIVFLEAVR